MPKVELSAFSLSSIDKAIQEIEKYQKRVETAGKRIVEQLANMGFEAVYTVLSNHVWSGETLDSLTVTIRGNKATISAESEALLFIEFGAGIHYAFENGGHPLADRLGFGPGTYPGQTHAYDPGGWWFPTDDPRLAVVYDKSGRGWAHSYGIPPYKPFYSTSVMLREVMLDVAKGAFAEND